jgi:hypothetical protein
MNIFLSGPMKKISNMGRMGDTELAHVNPEEKRLLKAMGGSGTMNPRTGMPEYFLKGVVSGIRRAFGQPDPEKEIQSGMDNAASDVADSATKAGQVDPLDTSDEMKALLFKRYKSDVLDKPYQSYTDTRYAGFNPDQQQAFTDVRTFSGSMPKGYQTATDTAKGETTFQSGFRTAGQDQAGFQRELDARMNPFTQSVINQLQKDISEQQQMALGRTGEQARAAGAFGGSRQGVAEALTSGRYGDAFARTAGQLRADQFNRAMSGVDQDRARQEQFRGQAAQTRLGAGRDLLRGTQATDAATAQRINALARAGSQQQAFEQAQKDFAYQQFLEERDFDKMNILAGGGLLGSAPGDYRPPPDPVYYGRSGGFGGLFDLLFGRPERLA